MGIEIERRFLLDSFDIRRASTLKYIQQGYISTDPDRVVRVRVVSQDGDVESYITVKGRGDGIARVEIESPIATAAGIEMLEAFHVNNIIYKLRYEVPHGDYTIEVDVFSGKLSGLIIAEIELPTVDAVVDIPEWMGKELRPNRLTNAYLSEIDDWGRI